MENKRNKLIILGIVLLVVVMITGISYALWQITLKQESMNVVNTACFKINFTDENEIDLQNAYPMSDESGMELPPYTFTIENICSTTATYQINLEELETELKKLSNQYVKLSLNNSKEKLLNSYEEVSPTLSDADTSHKLTTGVLKPDETKSFDLRLWMDEDTPAINDVMNASFLSKITIIAIQKEGLPEVEVLAEEYLDGITVDISTVENPKNEVLTYFYQLNEEEEIESESSIHTFTNLSDGKYKARGRAETQDGIILEEKELDVTIAYEQVYISNTGNDETGSGSIESPFATLQPAYNKVKSGGEMILLSDITATSTTLMNIENKKVTLRSDGEDTYSIFRGNSLTTQLLNVTNENTLTTTNIIFDGNNVNATTALLNTNSSTMNLNEGTIIKNSTNSNLSGSYGGGIKIYQSNLNIKGAEIRNNKVSSVESQGGGINAFESTINFYSGIITENVAESSSLSQGGGLFTINSTFNMYGGNIISNTSSYYGGGVIVVDGIMNLFEGTIISNVASRSGGGVVSWNHISKTTTIYIKGGIIENNTATTGPNTYTSGGAQIIDER